MRSIPSHSEFVASTEYFSLIDRNRNGGILSFRSAHMAYRKSSVFCFPLYRTDDY